MEAKEKKVLIVNDNVAVLVRYDSFFKDAGYVVETAASGEEALEILASQSFPVIVTDLSMQGMDGLELCREVRSRGFRGTLIAITAHSDKFEFSACREAGFDGYFQKPVEMEVLLEAVGELS
ncbi:response regulator receiver domain protein [delta proteobacterium NaphS2]|nr:response regulator receiver domain protein [delta proteobacterium NaphS2]